MFIFRRPGAIQWWFLVILSLLLLLGIALATGIGYIPIATVEVVKIIVAKVTGNTNLLAGINQLFPYVVWEVRLPRILTSVMVGAGLSLAGVVFQGILLNPLADPYTLGISAGAAFGASIALLLNLAGLGLYTVPAFAFAGAVLTLAAVLLISSFDRQTFSSNLILAGIIVAAILSAGISFIKYLADEHVSIIIFWLMGSFASRQWTDVLLTFGFVIVGAGTCLFWGRDLNIISLGDRSAGSLGIDTRRVRIILLVTASLITAGCVSVSGIIGFVGLIVPHLMRFIVGPDNRKLLPAAALTGGMLLLGADTITRAVLPNDIPVGVLTALIGGPVFCYIFRRQRMLRAHGAA